MAGAYDVLRFIQAALPTAGLALLSLLVVVLLVRKGADGQAVLIEVWLRFIDLLWPTRPAAEVRHMHRVARRATLANFEHDWAAKQELRAQYLRQRGGK